MTQQLDRVAREMKPENIHKIVHKNGDNGDIVTTVINAVKKHHKQAEQLGKTFAMQSASELGRLRNIYNWVKENIRYQVDPDGRQIIKSPAALVKIGHGDCKSLTVLIASILRHAGIKHFIRFTGKYETKSAPFTHVYVVALVNGKWVPMDTVWHQFNQEHPYKKKKDFTMQIESISGISGKQRTTGKNQTQPMKLADMTETDLSLAIAKQRFAIKAGIAKEKGANSLAGKYTLRALQAQELQKAAKASPEAVDQMVAEIREGMSGIGATKRAQARKDKKQAPKKAAKKNDRLDKTADKVKEGVLKKALKVVTAPARLAGKAAIEVLIPKSAMFFRYLFITKPDIIAKLPKQAADKRKKSVEVADFIVNGIGMKREHFMGLVRNGILKSQKMEPETLLQRELGGKINGIGLIDDAFKAVMELINLIKKITGKKGPNVTEKDIPDVTADGFGKPGSTEATNIGNDIKRQAPDDLDDDTPGDSPSGGIRRGICG